jgi:glycosyltransferase
MFLNADDALADPNVVGLMMASATAHGCPDVVYGDCDLHDQETGQRLYRAGITYDRRQLLRGRMLPHPGMFVHRRYFDRFGRFDTGFQLAMDYELLVRGVPEVGATRMPVLVTRVRTGGVSTRNRALVVDELIRALVKNKRFRFWFEPLVLRIRYALRYLLRRVAEALGLYKFWLKRERRFPGADNEDYGIRRSS